MENTKQTENSAEKGNKSKPMLANRLLKFRSWNGSSIIKSDSYISLMYFFDASNISKIMQFTNLLDKDKTEIYDGDIVEWWGISECEKMQVYWRNGAWHFKRFECNNVDWHAVDTTQITVIGNVFENPELL